MFLTTTLGVVVLIHPYLNGWQSVDFNLWVVLCFLGAYLLMVLLLGGSGVVDDYL